MSSLQDTPQQALAGWLHQRGGEKAIKKMADDLELLDGAVSLLMSMDAACADLVTINLAIAICLYTDGVVIFPSCPDWAVEKVKAAESNALDAALYKQWRDSLG